MGIVRSWYALQPDFAPISVSTAWAKERMCEPPDAIRSRKENAIIFQMEQFPVPFVHDPFNPPEHLANLAAVVRQFGVKRHAAIFIVLVQSRENLLVRLDADPLTGLEVQF